MSLEELNFESKRTGKNYIDISGNFHPIEEKVSVAVQRGSDTAGAG